MKLLFTIAVLICANVKLWACTCFEDDPYSIQSLVFNTFAFEGHIVRITRIMHDEFEASIRGNFKITKWLSPTSGPDTLSVSTPDNSCGLEFAQGQKWLVFANPNQGGRLASSFCDGSFLIDDSVNNERLRRYFNDLAIGSHKVDVKLNDWAGPYRIVGHLEYGEPVGEWLKVRGSDTVALYNFFEGGRRGMQMETDEETSPPERHYYEITRKNENTTVVIFYDENMKPNTRCEYTDGPSRFRYYVPYWDAVRYQVGVHFISWECKDDTDH